MVDALELAAAIGKHLKEQASESAWHTEPEPREDAEFEPIPNTLGMSYDGGIDLVKLATFVLEAVSPQRDEEMRQP